MVVHTSNFSTWEAKAGRLLQVWGQPGLHSESPFKKGKKEKRKEKKERERKENLENLNDNISSKSQVKGFTLLSLV